MDRFLQGTLEAKAVKASGREISFRLLPEYGTSQNGYLRASVIGDYITGRLMSIWSATFNIPLSEVPFIEQKEYYIGDVSWA
jgi:hypothetical protein